MSSATRPVRQNGANNNYEVSINKIHTQNKQTTKELNKNRHVMK